MGSIARFLVAPALIGLVFVGVGLGAASQANAASPRVYLIDNDGPTPAQGIDARSGDWGFSPMHITVLKGEAITFVSSAANNRPHNVVSFSRAGSASEPTLEVGAKFNSGLAQDTYIRPGNTWVLDTGGVDPGHWGYICTLHPWMVGSITVIAP